MRAKGQTKLGADYLVTAAPVYAPLKEMRGEERFPQGAQLLLVHEGKAEPLVKDFAATADADVSFDAKTVLFAGKRRRMTVADLGDEAGGWLGAQSDCHRNATPSGHFICPAGGWFGRSATAYGFRIRFG